MSAYAVANHGDDFLTEPHVMFLLGYHVASTQPLGNSVYRAPSVQIGLCAPSGHAPPSTLTQKDGPSFLSRTHYSIECNREIHFAYRNPVNTDKIVEVSRDR